MIGIPEDIISVLGTLTDAGYEAWCVGGCVRDLLLGAVPEDWDAATSALPEETMEVFGPRAIPTGLRHGTVTVTGPHPVEITTYRVDGAYGDHRRPDSVTFTRSLEEDLRRRDFTVNAMALGLDGTLKDPFGGQEDLRGGVLRCVGDPDCRFGEDALRILRGLRFASTLGFAIDPATAGSIHRSRELLRSVAAERIRVELEKLLRGKCAREILMAYPDVLGVFLPEILPAVGLNQRSRYHCYDVWEHTVRSVSAAPAEPVLRMTMLLHDLGKPSCFTVDAGGNGHFYGHPAVSRELAAGILRRLKFDNRRRDDILTLVEWHDRPIARTEKSLRRALRALGETNLRRLLAVKRADNLAQAPAYHFRQQEIDQVETMLDALLAADACVSLKQLAVTGRDMMALGLSGPAVGQMLDGLLSAVVDGKLPNDRQALLNRAAELRGR